MKRLEEQLTILVKPSVDLPLHRAQLRRAVLNSSLSRFGSFTRFSMSFSKLIPASLALVLVFGLAFTFRSQDPDYVRYVLPTASAQELVNGSIETLQALSAEEVEKIASDLGLSVDGLFKDLTEAVAAPDLSLVTMNPVSCEVLGTLNQTVSFMGFVGSDVQFSQNEDGTESPVTNTPCAAYTIHLDADQSSNTGYDIGFTFQGAQEISDSQNLTGVQYTDVDGNRAFLLLAENLIPYAGMHFAQDEMTMTFGG